MRGDAINEGPHQILRSINTIPSQVVALVPSIHC